MRVDEVRYFQQMQPFHPFAIHLVDGRSSVVNHPDVVSLSENGRSVTILNSEKLHEMVSTFLIVSLRPLKVSPPKKQR